jgi:ABC-2 type transport system permease protein
MSRRITLSTCARVLRQLRHDRRSVALILAVPAVLLALVHSMFSGDGDRFDDIGLVLLGVFPFLTMFLITSISMLRERTSGTLERLLTLPLAKLDLLAGYGIAFGVAAAVQALVAGGLVFGLLGLDTAGSPSLVVLIAVVVGVLGVALGLLCSAFARSEFQAVQFLPVVVLPQLLLCGLFVPRDDMSGWLQRLGDVLPLTYAVEALREVGANGSPTATLWRDLAIVAAATVASLVAAAATLRRRSG